MTPDQISTFQAVSGTSPSELSLILRSIVGALIFLWALWILFGAMHHLTHSGSIGRVFALILQVGFVLMLVLILIS